MRDAGHINSLIKLTDFKMINRSNANLQQIVPTSAWIEDCSQAAVDHKQQWCGSGKEISMANRPDFAFRLKSYEAKLLHRQFLLHNGIHSTSETFQFVISTVDAKFDGHSGSWPASGVRALKRQLRTLSVDQTLIKPFDSVYSSMTARLTKICTSIFESFDARRSRVALSLVGLDIELQPHQSMGVCVMLHELVTNALKHGFPKRHSGLVSVEFGVDQHSVCHLIVRDDGVGKPALRRRTTGLALVKGFAHLLQGTLEFVPSPKKTARVSFPFDG
jgi:two-component sensor histidine kinase